MIYLNKGLFIKNFYGKIKVVSCNIIHLKHHGSSFIMKYMQDLLITISAFTCSWCCTQLINLYIKNNISFEINIPISIRSYKLALIHIFMTIIKLGKTMQWTRKSLANFLEKTLAKSYLSLISTRINFFDFMLTNWYQARFLLLRLFI